MPCMFCSLLTSHYCICGAAVCLDCGPGIICPLCIRMRHVYAQSRMLQPKATVNLAPITLQFKGDPCADTVPMEAL